MQRQPDKVFFGMPIYTGCLVMLVLFVLVACQQSEPSRPAGIMPAPPEAVTPTTSPVARLITATSEPAATQRPSPAPRDYFTPTPSPTLPPTPTPTAVFSMCSPLENHTLQDLKEIITNPFDPPPVGKDTGHHGIDFAYYRRGDRASILGVTIQSVLPGRVTMVARGLPPYGNMIIIETPFSRLPDQLVASLQIPPGHSIYLLYAHMNKTPLPQSGDQVSCGQPLGEVGNTPAGWSSDPHLHLEGRLGPPGITFAGMGFYDTRATLEELDNYKRWRMSGEFALFDPMVLLSYGLTR